MHCLTVHLKHFLIAFRNLEKLCAFGIFFSFNYIAFGKNEESALLRPLLQLITQFYEGTKVSEGTMALVNSCLSTLNPYYTSITIILYMY